MTIQLGWQLLCFETEVAGLKNVIDDYRDCCVVSEFLLSGRCPIPPLNGIDLSPKQTFEFIGPTVASRHVLGATFLQRLVKFF